MIHHSRIDYLTIGHVSRDLTPAGPVIGGTAAYSSRVANMLGCKTAVLTSTNNDYDLKSQLPGIDVCRIPSDDTTTFENIYLPDGRQQRIQGVAKVIHWSHLPSGWDRASIVHFGPIANEVDPEMIVGFSNSLIGLTPQGWFRRWDVKGRVYPHSWPKMARYLKLAGAVILSLEDIPDYETLNQIRQWAPLVVLTQAAKGCTVFCRDETRKIPAPDVDQINPTGAGDVFAAAFLIRMYQTKGNPWDAAEFANRVAAYSVCHDSLDDKLMAIRELTDGGIWESN